MLAMKAQGHGVKLCSDGMGADRHLFALKSLAEERGEAIPAFFSTKVRNSLYTYPPLSLLAQFL
jgi:hypothetical protein